MGVISFTKLQHSGETRSRCAFRRARVGSRDKQRFTAVCLWLLAIAAASDAIGCRSSSARVDVAHLSFTMPTGWQQGPTSSSMRAAQAVVPGPAGDAELVVYFFGTGQGGNIEANLQRWMNQVIAGADAAPHRETFDNNGLRVTWIEVAGTIKPGEMGMGPTTAQPNSRLLGAVIEGERGPWFFKLTGPDATVAAQRDAFVALLRGATPRAD